MSSILEGDPRIDYHRYALAGTESTFPNINDVNPAYRFLKDHLPKSSFPPGYGISKSQVKPYNILSLPGSAAIVAPLIGNSTDPGDLFMYMALGQSAFEPVPSEAGFDDPGTLSAFIRSDLPFTDNRILDRLVSTASITRGSGREESTKYILHQLPIETVWASTAAIHALQRFNKITGSQLLDETGRLKENYSRRAMVINGDGGGGIVSVQHRERMGAITADSIIDFLSVEQTHFIAKLLNAEYAMTTPGACAGFGVAMNQAEIQAQRQEEQLDLFFVFSTIAAPFPETLKVFGAMGVQPSTQVPYQGLQPHGYTESQLAVVEIIATERLLRELGVNLIGKQLIRTRHDIGNLKTGSDRIRHGGIPEKTFQRGFATFAEYFPEGYPGSILMATHGVNTDGSMNEISALKQTKPVNLKGATILLDSTAAFNGHTYQGRAGLSSAILDVAIHENLFPGMATADVDLSSFSPNQESMQEIRRHALALVYNHEVKPIPLVFYAGVDEESVQRNANIAKRRANELAELAKVHKIHLAYSSIGINAANMPQIIAHTGLGANSILISKIQIDR